MSLNGRWWTLKASGTGVFKRRGALKAVIVLARKLAIVLHRIWRDGSDFRWSAAPAAGPHQDSDRPPSRVPQARRRSPQGRRERVRLGKLMRLCQLIDGTSGRASTSWKVLRRRRRSPPRGGRYPASNTSTRILAGRHPLGRGHRPRRSCSRAQLRTGHSRRSGLSGVDGRPWMRMAHLYGGLVSGDPGMEVQQARCCVQWPF